MTSKSPLLTLNSGVQIPAIGLGVFQSSPEQTVTAVESAIAQGYRLIDTAAAFVILTELPLAERVTTTDLTIHYLRPITEGRLLAKAKIVRGGRRIFVVNVEVTNAGRLVATAVTSYLKLQQNAQNSQ